MCACVCVLNGSARERNVFHRLNMLHTNIPFEWPPINDSIKPAECEWRPRRRKIVWNMCARALITAGESLLFVSFSTLAGRNCALSAAVSLVLWVPDNPFNRLRSIAPRGLFFPVSRVPALNDTQHRRTTVASNAHRTSFNPYTISASTVTHTPLAYARVCVCCPPIG